MQRISKCLSILQDTFEILRSARYPAEKMSKIVNACCALYNIALENGCFNKLISDENTCGNDECVDKSESSFNDGPECNPYYKFGSQVREDMIANLYDE